MQTIIKPFAEKNAVKVVAFAIQLTEQFSPDHIASIVNITRETQFFKDEFSNFTDQVEMSLTIGPDGVQQHSSANGILFEKKESDEQISWTTSINKDSIIVTCRAYTRWEQIAPKALKIINEVFSITKSVKIAQITLEYLDEFHIISQQYDWKKQLFRDNCNYILPSIYDNDSFWHINYGYFINISDLAQPLLDNLFINYFADEQDELKHKVNVRAQHKIVVDDNYDESFIAKYFGVIHFHSKSIFEEIIHDNILKLFDRGVK